jgi:hypothetical protein
MGKKLSFDFIKNTIETNIGYELISTEYKNRRTKLLIRCPLNHIFKMITDCFIRRGQRCPICALTKLKLDFVKEYISNFGYKCDSEVYISNKSPLIILCPNNHRCDKSFSNFKKGHRCSICCRFKSEEACRTILENHFNKIFIKKRHIWLPSIHSNNILELDGYCEEIQIAFEYNGIQHYKYHPFFHDSEEDFKQQVERDIYKKITCEARGIKLIVIPYTYTYQNIPELKEFILSQLN